MVNQWTRSGGEEGYEPVPDDVRQALGEIRIAEVLNIPATAVRFLPPIWVRNALIRLELDHLNAKRADQQRRKRGANPARRTR